MLPGDHTRPLLQTVGEVPTELRQAASSIQSQGEDFLNRLSGAVTQAGFGQVRPAYLCAMSERLWSYDVLNAEPACLQDQTALGPRGDAAPSSLLQASQTFNDFAKGITNLGTALSGSLASTNDAAMAEMQSLADEIVDWMADSLVLQPLPQLPAAGPEVPAAGPAAGTSGNIDINIE